MQLPDDLANSSAFETYQKPVQITGEPSGLGRGSAAGT